jgi:8-oxo-dGTP pyrophosphatase MutT (NUDIX family)
MKWLIVMLILTNFIDLSAQAGEIDKLGLILVKEKKLLVARSKGKDTFYIPGGKREFGETDLQAITREIREELSVDLIENTIKFVRYFEAQAHGNDEKTIVKLTAYSGDYAGTLKANSEIEELAWLEIKDKKRCSAVTQQVMDWLNSIGEM